MRIAVIDREKCRRQKCGYICQKMCPPQRMGEEVIMPLPDSEGAWPVISEPLCTGCGICPKKCPWGAIRIVNLPQELGTPIHQYGVNAFRVYGLPLPRKGAIVGLVGANGIGKTTALQILSGALAPNMGKLGEAATPAQLAAMFRGQELQNYFNQLKGIGVSHKPQDVSALAKLDTTVAEFLARSGSDGVEQAAEDFELEPVLDRKLANLSGGELQRVAIAATCLKAADLYCFDEPSSYLDIRQRLRTAKLLQKLTKNASVALVEHDLAILDYLSDFTVVFYGQRSVFGVASGLKATRSGINEYLQGYLRDENVRFRPVEIKFEVRAPVEAKKRVAAFSYPALKQRYRGFSLDAEPGSINEGEVIGILGPNAIGKSTFVRMLAGAERPKEGEIAMVRKISYKPQYIQSDFPGTVVELVSSMKDLDSTAFEQLKADLEIGELMEKEVGHLSGGELQRLAIVLCLARNADMYLLDEPSAFLDIEQRLRFATALKRRMETSGANAFVVDHDVVLIDIISHRLIVFDGQPSIKGVASAPQSMRAGMNSFLKSLDVTLRRDPDTGRPRVNKADSVLDREQKEKGEYYYAG